MLFRSLLSSALLFTPLVAAASGASAGADASAATVPAIPTEAPAPGQNVRVGGDLAVVSVWNERKGEWRSGSSTIDTSLPVGYPAPTPPGAIDLKTYPSVRRAELQGGAKGENAFWPLFQHIQRHDIAMTSPVERDYVLADGHLKDDGMSFLYRVPELHPTGVDAKDSRVVIYDTEPLTVVSLGGRGSYERDRIKKDVGALLTWLEKHPQWEVAGEPRALMYNGPTLFGGRKWLEVQLPIRPATRASETADPIPPANP
jgi:hypothetical protein